MISDEHMASTGNETSVQPTIRDIRWPDLKDALAKGYDDFKAMPTHLIFLCLVYPVVTLVVARGYAGYDILPLVFPLLAGYTLIGPLVALGVYELSRRREKGLDTSRWHSFEVLRSPSIVSIILLGLVLMGIYFGWLAAAQAIYEMNFGTEPPESVGDFVKTVLSTGSGWTLIAVGSSVGFLFAVVVFTLGVISFPMLLDKDVHLATAVQTSVRAVAANPMTMGVWAITIAVSMFLGSLPFFVGLAVVLPVLGHASWHVYRKVVQY